MFQWCIDALQEVKIPFCFSASLFQTVRKALWYWPSPDTLIHTSTPCLHVLPQFPLISAVFLLLCNKYLFYRDSFRRNQINQSSFCITYQAVISYWLLDADDRLIWTCDLRGTYTPPLTIPWELSWSIFYKRTCTKTLWRENWGYLNRKAHMN